jgi:hypothetical protein
MSGIGDRDMGKKRKGGKGGKGGKTYKLKANG